MRAAGKAKYIVLALAVAFALFALVPYVRMKLQLERDKSELLDICQRDHSIDHDAVRSDDVVRFAQPQVQGLPSLFLAEVEPRVQVSRDDGRADQFDTISDTECDGERGDETLSIFRQCYRRTVVERPSRVLVEYRRDARSFSRLTTYTRFEITLSVDGTPVGRRVRHGIGDRKVRGFGEAFPHFFCGEDSGSEIRWVEDLLERIR